MLRVRCVDDSPYGGGWYLSEGAEYVVEEITSDYYRIRGRLFFKERFKPVVRVKAKCVPSLDLLVKRAVARFNALTLEQQAAHWQAQRDSWVRGEMSLAGSERNHIFAHAGW